MSLKNTSSCLGYQQITSLSAAAGLTVPAGATLAIIQAEAQIVRWRDDGTNPTAAVGMTIAAAATLVYDGNLNAIKFIEATASAKLNVAYYS
jgi:predicted hotdog family 3-hydroxylacyl-ACP dehydratase